MPAGLVVNWEDGSSARYDTGAMWEKSPGVLTDGTYEYDSEGRPLSGGVPGDGPGQWVDGFPGARGGGAPGGGGSAGGGSSVFGNPYYQQYEAAQKAQGAADLADTKTTLQQLLIQFGLIPGNYNDKLGALDDTIRQLIQQNTESGISQYARMLEAKGDTNRDTINRLYAGGLGRSGAKGYNLRRNQLNFDRTFSDALNAVLSSAQQIQSGYANRESGRQMSLSQMLAQLMTSWKPSGSFGGGAGFSGGGAAPAYSAPAWQDLSPGAPGTPTIGGGWVGQPQQNVSLGGGSGTSSKKPLLF